VTLLGFKSADKVLDPGLHVRSPYFLRPDDKEIANSARAFNALLGAMNDRRVVALARFVARRGSQPQLVALVPLPDLRTEQNELVSGGGMFVEFLPFADDIRCPVFEGGLVEVDGDLVARASVLVESLRMGEFDPSRFENPALQKYWSGVEHLALPESKLAEWTSEHDTLLPPEELCYNPQLDKICKAFAFSYGGPGQLDSGKRRARAENEDLGGGAEDGGESASGTSKHKKEKLAADRIDWAAKVADGSVAKLTVDVLKQYCREHDLPLGGNKGELLQRVTGDVTSAL
jgi:ATP-dependent DNA helicase 2 subunit 1